MAWLEVTFTAEYDNVEERKNILESIMPSLGRSAMAFSISVADETEEDEPIQINTRPPDERPA